jgi:GrpB-like predicted nucleotidyltransferase (UPF0157 family)
VGGQEDDGTIGPYEPLPVACHPWDPRAPEVAQRVAALIHARLPEAVVEHVGSTAVPGCAGKGVVDLLLLYPPGHLAAARDALDDLGFQHQGGRHPWPEERPMRVGSVRHAGTVFQLHVHVVAADAPNAAELLRFRDALRADPGLVAAYVAAKRAALAAAAVEGVAYASGDAIEYTQAKTPIVERVLGAASPGDSGKPAG